MATNDELEQFLKPKSPEPAQPNPDELQHCPKCDTPMLGECAICSRDARIAELEAALERSREWAESQNKSALGWNGAWKEMVQQRDQALERVKDLEAKVEHWKTVAGKNGCASVFAQEEMKNLTAKLNLATQALVEIGHGSGPANWSGAIAREALKQLGQSVSEDE